MAITNKLIAMLPTSLYLFTKLLEMRLATPDFYKALQQKRNFVDSEGYSYKHFDEYKCIFIHIPKCAGISVNKALFGSVGAGHASLSEYLYIFEPKALRDYFKFTFVRNPWDRVVSAYFFLQKGGMNNGDAKWFSNELSQFETFEEFVTEWLTRENIWKSHHFRPQYNYILDKFNKVKLDFIGYTENIDKDFEFIRKKIGTNIAIPKANSSSHKPYQHYYSEQTKQIVQDVYKEDIALLHYDFDNSLLDDTFFNTKRALARANFSYEALRFVRFPP